MILNEVIIADFFDEGAFSTMSKIKSPLLLSIMGCVSVGLVVAGCGGDDAPACKVQCKANCYAYALNISDPSVSPQPGAFAGTPTINEPEDITQANVVTGAKADATAMGTIFSDTVSGNSITRDTICPAGTYKVALAIDPYTGVGDTMADYHWLRQNPDGTWSGKSGSTAVTDKDASGNVITDPETANLDYSGCLKSQGVDNAQQYGFPVYTFSGYYCVGPKP